MKKYDIYVSKGYEKQMEKVQNIDNYIWKHWPKDIPDDCSFISPNPDAVTKNDDCMTRGELREKWCASCRKYDELFQEAEAIYGKI